MKKHNVVVIGSAWGDEGKGRSVDFLARSSAHPLVIRFNGGGQAGHTVWLTADIHHVFHTYGSGTFQDADTFLSKHVMFDPFLADRERSELHALGYSPKLYIDTRCRIVTLYDIFFGQLRAVLHGHGSCGLGINDTVDRSEYIALSYADIWDEEAFARKIAAIADYYAGKISLVTDGLGISAIPASLQDFATKIFSQESSNDYAQQLFSVCQTFKQSRVPDFHTHSLIFEGAQGLMLDEYYGNFPHVTRSRTGSQNVVDFCRERHIAIDEIFYITRCYATRHGYDAAFSRHARDISGYFAVVDSTNVHNPWQGTMQYDFLNIDTLTRFINQDLHYGLAAKHTLVMTCLDQMTTTRIPIIANNTQGYVEQSLAEVQADIAARLNSNVSFKVFADKVNNAVGHSETAMPLSHHPRPE